MKTNHFTYSILIFVFGFFAGYNSYAQTPIWQLVKPKYPTVDAVVAGFVVDANEWGKGGKDATAYVQSLMDNLDNCTGENQKGLGGGVIFFPEGKYRFDGTLTIPKGVTLRGEWKKPVKGQKIAGTVFEVYSGKRSEEGTEFIRMNSSAAVMDLAFWYPEQDPNNIIPYPATIRMQLPGGQGATFVNVKNVTLVNSYGGVWFPGGGRCPIVSGIYGTPLKFGVEIDQIDDVGRVEWCDFSPEYWAGSGMPNSPSISNTAYTNWMRNNSTGIVMRKNDWTYASYINVEGYYIGYQATHSRLNITDVPNGQNYGLSFTNCKYGLRFESHADIGVMFTDVIIRNCDYGIYLNQVAGEILQLYKWDIDAGAGNYALFSDKQSTAIVSLMESKIASGKILLQGSTLLATGNDFNNAVPQLQFEANSRGDLLGNRFKGSPGSLAENVVNKTMYKLEFNSTPVVIQKLPERIEVSPEVKKPAGTTFIDVTKAPYNVQWVVRTRFPKDPASCTVADATPGIQAALNAAGAAGGGIVFLRPGHYRINGSLTIPSGVELAGAANISSAPSGAGATLEIYANQNNPAGPSPVILSANSGIRGVAFNYPGQTMCDNVTQQILADSPNHNTYDVLRYPYTIKGNGDNVYIVNVGMRAAYKGADLSNCNNFYIDHLNGMFWKEGVYIQNANNGKICNMQCNPMIYTVGDESGYGFWPNSVRNCTMTDANSPYMYDYLNLNFVTLDNTKNTILYNDFNYGTLNGIVLRNGVEGTAIGFGLDNDNICLLADGNNIKFDFINTQFCALQSAKSVLGLGDDCTYIQTTSNYGSNSKINMFASDYGGSLGKSGVMMDGTGTFNLYAANFNQSGNQSAVQMNAGKLDMFCSQLRSSNSGNTATGAATTNLKIEGCYDRNKSGKNFTGYVSNIGPDAEMAGISGALNRTGWVATSNVSNNRAQNMLDNNAGTNWDCSMQNSGSGQSLVWVKIDMITQQIFNQIMLEYSSNPNDFPEKYIAEISDNDTNWTQIAAGDGKTSNCTVINVPKTTARYIRITKPAGTSKANYWTISEFYVILGDKNITPVLEPYSGQPVALPGLIEAEDYNLGGEGIAYHDFDATNNGNAHYRTTEGVDIENGSTGKAVSYIVSGEWLKYTVEIAKAGMYTMKNLVSSPTGSSFFIEINGIDVSGSISVPNTGSYDIYTEITNYVALSRGLYEMTFKTDGNMNIDNFKFEDGVGYLNGYPHIIPGKIEAEEYDFGGEGVAYHDDGTKDGDLGFRPGNNVDVNSGEGSTGYFVGWTNNGEWINYTIQAKMTGTYNVTCHVSSNNGSGSFLLSIDGQNVNVMVPNTGSYGTYTDVTVPIYITAGVHVMKFSTNGNHNIDYFNFEYIYSGTPFKTLLVPGIIEAEDFDKGGEGVAWHDTNNNTYSGYRENMGVKFDNWNDPGKPTNVAGISDGEWLRYTIKVTQAGVYDINCYVATPNNGGSFRLYFPFESGMPDTGEINVPNTGAWNSWQQLTLKDIWLPIGEYCMEIAIQTGNFNLDKFVFKPAYQGTPFKTLLVPGIIEAEDFDKGGEGVAWHDTNDDVYSGYRENMGVKFDNWNNSGKPINVAGISDGEWLRYTIQVMQAGVYDIDCYVATPNNGGSFRLYFPFEFGELPDSGVISVPNTGAWDNWQKLMLTDIPLPEGEYCMEIAIQTGNFNLDKFDFHTKQILKSSTGIEKTETGNPIKVHVVAQRLTVQSSADDPICEIAVYDVMGRLIAMKTNCNQSFVTLNLSTSRNLLIVKVRTEKASLTQEIQGK